MQPRSFQMRTRTGGDPPHLTTETASFKTKRNGAEKGRSPVIVVGVSEETLFLFDAHDS